MDPARDEAPSDTTGSGSALQPRRWARRHRQRRGPDSHLEPGDRQRPRVLRSHGDERRAVLAERQGIVSASFDGRVLLWDVKSGRSRSVPTLTGSKYAAAIDATAKRIAIGGATPLVIQAPDDGSGDRLVSAGDDGTIRVWDAAGGDALVVLHRHEGIASGADFSGDGRDVVSAGDDGMLITACEVCGTVEDVLRVARTRAQHTLTAAERQRLLPRD